MRTKLSGLILFFLSFILFFACSPSVSNNNTEGKTDNKTDAKVDSEIDSVPDNKIDKVAPKTLIVYYEKSGKYYEYFIQELPGDSAVLLANFETLPADVIWDTTNNLVYFVTQEGVLMKNYQNKDAKFQKLSYPLPKGVIGMFSTAWIDKETREICLSYGINVDQTNIAKYKKLAKQEDYLIDYGLEVIVGILRLNKSGNWDTIVEKASKCCAGLTPGLLVLYDYINVHDKYVSTSAIISNSMCFYGVQDNVDQLDDTDLEQYFKGAKVPFADAFFLAELSESVSLLVPASWGDSRHFIPPCYFWDSSKNKFTEIIHDTIPTNVYHDQLGIQITKDYLLVASEYDHESPKIFDIRTLKLIYNNPAAVNAFILQNE